MSAAAKAALLRQLVVKFNLPSTEQVSVWTHTHMYTSMLSIYMYKMHICRDCVYKEYVDYYTCTCQSCFGVDCHICACIHEYIHTCVYNIQVCMCECILRRCLPHLRIHTHTWKIDTPLDYPAITCAGNISPSRFWPGSLWKYFLAVAKTFVPICYLTLIFTRQP